MKHFSLTVLVFLFLFCAPSIFAISIDISNLEAINDYYSLDAVITGAATDSSYYVQAIFKKENSSNFSGFTWSEKGEWLKYDGSPEKEYIKENFPLLVTDQARKLLVKPDPDKGSGNFTLRLRRYTGGSTNHTGDSSNELSLVVQGLIAESIVSPTATTSPTSTPTPTPTPTPTTTIRTPTPTSVASKTPTPTATTSPTSTPTLRPPTSPTSSISATVSATISSEVGISLESSPSTSTQTPSPSPEIKGASTSSSAINKIIILLGLILTVPAAALYFLSDRVKISR